MEDELNMERYSFSMYLLDKKIKANKNLMTAASEAHLLDETKEKEGVFQIR